ncbi:MAG: DUF4339 domain-containing protein [Deltaproteobacteria bacterium]|nr:DUF4339 domain-containing protein [Deltaproteobacteria bacterium]
MEEKSAGKTDKIWFLYVVDEHEGPFTIPEIKQRLKKGDAKATSYVWRAGLKNWTVMRDLPEFGIANGGKAKGPPPGPITVFGTKGTPVTKTIKPSKEGRPELGARAPKRFPLFKTFFWLLLLAGLYQAVVTGTLDPVLEKANVKEKIHALGLPKIPVPVEPVRKFARPYVVKVLPMLPKQARALLTPVEIPDDISPKDADALREAAWTPIEQGARITVALPVGAEFDPVFVFAGNTPDGTNLDLLLKGKSGALLNARDYEARTSATFKNHLARSAKLQLAEGKPLPRGEYTLIAYESDNQPPEVSLALAATPRKATPSLIPQGKSAFSVDVFFLGGKRDASYEEKLKAWNEKLRAQLEAESAELRDLSATLENMANEGASKFFKLSKSFTGKNPKADKKITAEWKKYAPKYEALSNQIRQKILVKADRLFPAVYDEASKAFELSQTLHKTESDFFEKKVTMDQIRAQAAATLEALNLLKNMVEEKVK